MHGSLPSRGPRPDALDTTSGAAFRVARVSVAGLAARPDDWARLCAESLEDNVFLHPAFALPLLSHMPGDRATEMWIVERGTKLVGLIALGRERPGRRRLAYTWQSRHACLGFPLLHRDHAGEALRAILDALAVARPSLAGLVLQTVPANGPTAGLLRDLAAEYGLTLLERDAFTRPMFRPHTLEGRATLSPKSKLDTPRLRTSRRRLERQATLTHGIAQDTAELASTARAFLALEARGWKGRAGTALACEDATGAFAEAVLASLDPSLHRIHALRLDGQPIAMAFMLRDRDGTDYFWKIAYDEAWSAASPGRQLLAVLTRAQARAGIELTDSCAVPEDPLVAPRWPERRAFSHLAIALAPRHNRALSAAFWRIDVARRWSARLRRLNIREHVLIEKVVRLFRNMLARFRPFRATDVG